MMTTKPSQSLRNIGPVSWRMLERARLSDVDAVRRAGAVGAYVAVLDREEKGVSLNLLYALAAGLRDCSWLDVDEDEKGRLKREVEDLRDAVFR